MPDLIINTAFNLYVGNAGPDNDKRLILKNLKLPEFEEICAQHHSGGSLGEIEVGGLGLKALMLGFKSTGWDPQTMSQFGIGGRVKFPYTFYGNAVQKSDGTAIQIIAKVYGRLTKVMFPELKRGDLMEIDHEVKEVLIYQVYYNGKEKYYYNWGKDTWRVDGIVQNQDEVNNLGGAISA